MRGHEVTQAEAHGKGEASRRERDSVRGAYLDSDNAPQSLSGGKGVEARAGMGRAWRESQALGGIRGGFRDRQEGNGKIRAETDRTLGLDSGSPGLAEALLSVRMG